MIFLEEFLKEENEKNITEEEKQNERDLY